MGYFPFFVDIAGQEGLIVGGGHVALGKLRRLLPFQPHLTVAAPEILPEIAGMDSVTVLRQPFSPELLTGKAFVIAATSDTPLNRTVSRLCQAWGIPVNVVDDKEACTFLFPALVQQGKLTVGISTSGASPSAAVYVKNQLRDTLPEAFPEILDFLADQRSLVQARFAEEARRAKVLGALFAACMEKERALEAGELEALLSAWEEES